MAMMTQINHADLAFFDRLAKLSSDRQEILPPSGTFFTDKRWEEVSPDHDTQYEHMTNMTGYIGCNMEDDYLIALEHITMMAKRDGIKFRMWDVIHATGLTLRVDTTIAASMILGSMAFMSGEWLITLLLPF